MQKELVPNDGRFVWLWLVGQFRRAFCWAVEDILCMEDFLLLICSYPFLAKVILHVTRVYSMLCVLNN